jgi:peptide/nickel transport system permease protein
MKRHLSSLGGFAFPVRVVLTRVQHGRLAIGLVLGIAGLAIVSPMVWGAQAKVFDMARANQGASAAHLLGTDALGRDVLLRVLVASRTSLLMAIAATAMSAVLGICWGASAALIHRFFRGVANRTIEVATAFPVLLIALTAAAILGPSASTATIAIGSAFSPTFARVTSTLVASFARQDYIAAARVVGVPRTRILSHYLLPNVADVLLVSASYMLGLSLVAVSSLSFLGVGVQPPQWDWGGMLAEGVRALYTTPLEAIAPAVAITSCGVIFGFVGEVFARACNPRLWVPLAADPKLTQVTPPEVGVLTAAALPDPLRRTKV